MGPDALPSGSLGGTDKVNGGGGIDQITFDFLHEVSGYLDSANSLLSMWDWGSVGTHDPDVLHSTSETPAGTVEFSNLEFVYFGSYDLTDDAQFPTFDFGHAFAGEMVAGGAGNDHINYDGSSAAAGWFANADGVLVFGGGGDDVIYGAANAADGDILFGGAGNDTIYGQAGNDEIIAWTGDDTLYGGPGIDLLEGEAGNDTLYSGDGIDALYGDEGNDILHADGGTNALYGGADDDTFYVYDGTNNMIYGGADISSGDTLSYSNLTTGVGVLFSGETISTTHDGAGDTISGVETIYGSGNIDTFTISEDLGALGVDVIDGGAGNDLFDVAAGVTTNASLLGGAGDDTVTIADGATLTSFDGGAGGSDSVHFAGTAGGTATGITNVSSISADQETGVFNVTLADAANYSLSVAFIDNLTGGAGNDEVTYSNSLVAGNTVDLGGEAGDYLYLLATANTVAISNVEYVVGTAAADALTLSTSVTGVSVNLGNDTDTLNIASGASDMSVSGVENIAGTGGGHTLTFNSAVTGVSVDLSGGAADTLILSSLGTNSVSITDVETVTGGSASDTVTFAIGGTTTLTDVEFINGSSAVDDIVVSGSLSGVQIVGGGGGDSLTASSGNDVFKYNAATESDAGNIDTISGFNASGDLLNFTSFAASNVSFLGYEGSTFTGGGVTSARFNDTSDLLEIDTDGLGNAIMQITLSGVALGDLTDADFTALA